MLKQFLTSALLMAAGAAIAADPSPQWPNDAKEDSDPRVSAWYQWKCATWADEHGLGGKERQSWVDNCTADARQIWPVGYENNDN
jgi:hypothetical protein